MRVGIIKKDSTLVSRRVILGNLFRFLGQYVETVPVPVSWVPDSALAYQGLVDGDRIVGDLGEMLAALEELQLDYVYPLAFLVPYFFIARELCGARISFLLSVPCASPDKWFMYWLLLAPLLRPGDVVMIPNETARQALVRISPVYENQPALIPRSIDLQRVDRELAEHPYPSDSPVLVYLGRLDQSKNVHLLIEALPDVLKQVPDARLRLLVPIMTRGGGNFSPPYYQRIRQRCRTLSLEDHVDFIEPPDEGNKYRSVADSAASVFLSLFSGELFGYAVLEALACGVPVVCTAWSGYRELVTDKCNGFLIPTFWNRDVACLDEEALRRTLISILTSDAEERGRMSVQARASAARYDYRRVIPRLVSNFVERGSAGNTYAGRRQSRQSFERLLGRPIGATEGIWTDSLFQFEELASLSYGAIAGMGCSRSEMMKAFAFLRAANGKLGQYLNGHYVSATG